MGGISGLPACVVDDSPTLSVEFKHRDGFPSTEIPHNGDTPSFEGCDPSSRFGTFVKSDCLCIAGSGAAQYPPDAGPRDCAETHGAGLATGDQFMFRYAGSAEVKMTKGVLRVGKGHQLGMGKRAGHCDDEVRSDRDQPSRPRFEDGRGEGAAASPRNVCPGHADDKLHAVFIRPERPVRLPHKAGRPSRQAERMREETTLRHDGRAPFKASKFLVTMRSPFWEETSMPVVMTVRHSSSRFKA